MVGERGGEEEVDAATSTSTAKRDREREKRFRIRVFFTREHEIFSCVGVFKGEFMSQTEQLKKREALSLPAKGK